MLINKLKVIIIAILVFAALFILGQYFLPDKYVIRLFVKTGTLRVESAPKTSVFVNSNFVGQTPLYYNLKAGNYSIKLVPETGQANLISWSKQVSVVENRTTYIYRQLAAKDLLSSGEILFLEEAKGQRAQIQVNTDPPGVLVSLDGEDKIVSPLFMENISPGTHELTVRGERLIPRTIKINAIDGYKLIADFKLQIDPDYEKDSSKPKQKAGKSKAAQRLKILDTPTGWLRVREAPGLNASESAQVLPGEEYNYFTKQDNWYQIEYDANKLGWVSGEYVELLSETDLKLEVNPTVSLEKQQERGNSKDE